MTIIMIINITIITDYLLHYNFFQLTRFALQDIVKMGARV